MATCALAVLFVVAALLSFLNEVIFEVLGARPFHPSRFSQGRAWLRQLREMRARLLVWRRCWRCPRIDGLSQFGWVGAAGREAGL